MNINFTGRHMQVTEALKQYAEEKLGHLTEYYKKITSIQVIFEVEKTSQIAEARMHVPNGQVIHAMSESGDMYASIDLMVEKLKRQLMKHKEKETEHR